MNKLRLSFCAFCRLGKDAAYGDGMWVWGRKLSTVATGEWLSRWWWLFLIRCERSAHATRAWKTPYCCDIVYCEKLKLLKLE